MCKNKIPVTFSDKVTAIHFTRHTFQVQVCFNRTKDVTHRRRLFSVFSVAVTHQVFNSQSTTYLSVLQQWFAFNESHVCLKWHEPVLHKHLLSAINNEKKVYSHNLQILVIILDRVLVLCVVRVARGREHLPTWFSLRQSFLWLWVFSSSSFKSPILCNRPHYQKG